MNVTEAKKIAQDLMTEHGLTDPWRLEFNAETGRRVGWCNSLMQVISLSLAYVEMAPDAEVLDTILHEIAHGLTAHGLNDDDGERTHHGPKWRAKFIELGGTGNEKAPDQCTYSELAKAGLTEAEARRLIKVVKTNGAKFVAAVRELFERRAHLFYGFKTFAEFVKSEFPDMPRVAMEQRDEYITELDDAGMTVRDIGVVVGLGKSRVAEVLKGLKGVDDAPESDDGAEPIKRAHVPVKARKTAAALLVQLEDLMSADILVPEELDALKVQLVEIVKAYDKLTAKWATLKAAT